MNAVSEIRPAALQQQSPAFDLSPRTFEQALTFAGYLAESDMVPKDFKGRPGNCLIAIQWGAELGLKPLQADIQLIAAAGGTPADYGRLAGRLQDGFGGSPLIMAAAIPDAKDSSTSVLVLVPLPR